MSPTDAPHLPAAPAVVRERPGGEQMHAIILMRVSGSVIGQTRYR